MPVRTDFAPGQFCWVDLMAHDLDGAIAFYSRLFDWDSRPQLVQAGPPYAMFTKDGAVVGGVGEMDAGMRASGLPPVWNGYVGTSDCAASEARARELGATVTVPTTQVPGHGRLAFFLDPEGASFAVWQSTGEPLPMRVGEHGTWCWNELMHRDGEGARAFYGALFGWEFASTPMAGSEYVTARAAGQDACGMLRMEGERFDQVPVHWMVYFNVDDCASTSEAAVAGGGAVVVPPTPFEVGTFAVLQDPQGGTFGVIQLAAAAG